MSVRYIGTYVSYYSKLWKDPGHRYLGTYVSYYSIIMEGSRSAGTQVRISVLLLCNYGRTQVSRCIGTHISYYSIIMEGPRSADT